MKINPGTLVIVIGLLLFSFGTLSAAEAPTIQIPTATIRITDSSMEPDVLVVSAGTRITWENSSSERQTVTSVDEVWQEVTLEPGVPYSRQFDAPGTYYYYSTGHANADGEVTTSTIIVEPSAITEVTPVPTQTTVEPVIAAPDPQQLLPYISVSDQSTANLTATVANAATVVDGFLVIHTADESGAMILDETIGAVPIAAGEHINVIVPLTRQVPIGTTLYAVLHSDSGMPQVFEFPGVDQPVMLDNQIVAQSFVVTEPTGVTPTPVPEIPPSLPPSGEEARPPVRMIALGLILLGAAQLVRQRLRAEERKAIRFTIWR